MASKSNVTIVRMDVPDSAIKCVRCGELPDAMHDVRGFTMFHLCRDRLSLAANYATMAKAVEEWNSLQEPK